MDSKILFPVIAALCVAVMALPANSSADERTDNSSGPIIDPAGGDGAARSR
jgi:hypothetical protein